MSNVRTVFVVNGGVDVGSALAQGLAARGSRVVLLDDGERPANPSQSHERIACSLASRAALAAAFDDAVARFGVPDQVVASILSPVALHPYAIHELPNEIWQLACRDAMKGLLYALQAAFTPIPRASPPVGQSAAISGSQHGFMRAGAPRE